MSWSLSSPSWARVADLPAPGEWLDDHRQGILAFLSALAQDERERILKRYGLKYAKARGVHCGRPPALNDYQREEAAQRLAEGESARSVARLLGVRHVTVAKLRVA